MWGWRGALGHLPHGGPWCSMPWWGHLAMGDVGRAGRARDPLRGGYRQEPFLCGTPVSVPSGSPLAGLVLAEGTWTRLERSSPPQPGSALPCPTQPCSRSPTRGCKFPQQRAPQACTPGQQGSAHRPQW